MSGRHSVLWLVGLALAVTLVAACGDDDTDSVKFGDLDPNQRAVATSVCQSVTQGEAPDDVTAAAVTAGDSGVSAFEDMFSDTPPEDREGDAFINQASTICAEMEWAD